MQRSIAGWRSDEHGDWVALLDCGHRQHVRHRPPFFDRPWVEQVAGRAARLGTLLDCPLCDRSELPDGLTQMRSTPVWDRMTVPAALLADHRTAGDTWALLVVDDGRVAFRAPELAATGRPATLPVEPGRPQPIPPGVLHGVAPEGPARFHVEFFRVPRPPESDAGVGAGDLSGAASRPGLRPP
jgi:tellurite resistance-related uncharacterized protein